MSHSSNAPNMLEVPIRKGRFYFIFEDPGFLILIDKTKRGLELRDKVVDDQTEIITERGVIYDMDGRGHKVGLKWLYPKSKFTIEFVVEDAERMEKKYKDIRDMTCPSDL